MRIDFTDLVGAIVVLMWSYAVLQSAACHADTIPTAAAQYQRMLVRSAHAHWGLDAPVATFAGQIHQESRWNPEAISPAGARGLAQFMPSTSEWLTDLYREHLATDNPTSPRWALQAVVLYDRWLYQRIAVANTCQRGAMMLSSYNGGLGWLQRDQRLARAAGDNASIWFNSVENHTARADWAKSENRRYVRQITQRWEPLYVAAGWGPGVCDEN